jgi:hypothetical protein
MNLRRLGQIIALSTTLSGCNGQAVSERAERPVSLEVAEIIDSSTVRVSDSSETGGEEVHLEEIQESFEVQEERLFDELMASLPDVSLDDLGLLLEVDSPQLRNYLSLLVNSGTGLEKLFERRILSRRFFERFMDLETKIAQKCESLKNDSNPNIARDCLRMLAQVQNQQPGSQRDSIRSYFDADFQESESFVRGSEILERVNTILMPSVYSDRTLGLTIMLSESFPEPHTEDFPVVAREAIALLMLDSGFNPNYNVNDTARLVGGPWHLYYSVFSGLNSGTQDSFVSEVAANYNGMMVEPEFPFYSMAENSELATLAFETLMLDNLNRLENLTVYGREFNEEQKQKFAELFNNPANSELFIILALYFHKTGGSLNTMEAVIEQITLNDFDVPRIIDAIGRFDEVNGNSEYARKGLILYRELSQSGFFVENF